MKTNCKLSNTNYKFSKNFFKALIAPIVAVVLAIVFMFTIGFNRDMDYTGGIYVSVVAVSQTTGEKLDLSKSENYNTFKKDVDDVLSDNKIKGQVYTAEVNNMQESVDLLYNKAILDSNAIITMSPAHASYGLYKNFEERGRDFKNIVSKIS